MSNSDNYLTNLANLLNGQLRGSINAVAREENLSLISMTLSKLQEDSYNLGFQQGISEALKEQVKEDLKRDIRSAMEHKSE